MTTYTINYTQAENLAMSYITLSIDEWIQNACHHRASIAMDEIIKISVEKCLEHNVQIPSSKDEMVELAFSQGWIKSIEDSQKEISIQPIE